MVELREWDGSPTDLLYATACALFQFSAAPQTECREMLMVELGNWFRTARQPVLGTLGIPAPAR